MLPPAPSPASAPEPLPASLRQFFERYVQPTPAEYAQLGARVVERRVRRGEVLCATGQVCEFVYFVVAGTARHFRAEERGSTGWFSFAGDVMTEAASFFRQQPSLFTIAAVTDLHVYALSRTHLNELYAASQTWERCGRFMAESYLLVMARHAFVLRFQSARERYKELLLRQPDVELHVPLGYIASYLGMAQETLSRLRSH